MGLVVATSALQAVEFIGMPEGKIVLSQATLYLACAAKSNSSVMGIGNALEAVQQGEVVQVPTHLRDAHYPGAKKLGHGVGYQYSHDFSGAIAPQNYGIKPGRFFKPTDHGYEAKIKARLAEWEKLRANAPKKKD
jgi:putative ATPase